MDDAHDICEACIAGDHDECVDSAPAGTDPVPGLDGCLCIDMEHDNEEQRAYALHDGWVT